MSKFQERPEAPAPEEQSSGQSGSARAFLALSRFLGSRLALLLLAALGLGALIYIIVSADSFLKSGELAKEKAKLEAEIEVLKDENHLLRQKIDRMLNDPAYVEDEARKKLGLIRPGETIYRLAEEPDLSDEEPEEPPLSPSGQ
jgi:Septum formation initiator